MSVEPVENAGNVIFVDTKSDDQFSRIRLILNTPQKTMGATIKNIAIYLLMRCGPDFARPCFESTSTIAKNNATSTQTAHRALRKLRDMGFYSQTEVQPGDKYPNGIRSVSGGRVRTVNAFWFEQNEQAFANSEARGDKYDERVSSKTNNGHYQKRNSGHYQKRDTRRRASKEQSEEYLDSVQRLFDAAAIKIYNTTPPPPKWTKSSYNDSLRVVNDIPMDVIDGAIRYYLKVWIKPNADHLSA
ncbi:MAG: hypothetical protein JXR76_05870 [Deltaproteobacteria bacterium]|nr:hypothetical protein [Deltaproteobacteria bacterium]